MKTVTLPALPHGCRWTVAWDETASEVDIIEAQLIAAKTTEKKKDVLQAIIRRANELEQNCNTYRMQQLFGSTLKILQKRRKIASRRLVALEGGE